VERVCPVHERKRERSAQKADKKYQKKIAEQRESYSIGDLDLRRELTRVWRIAQRLEPQLRNVKKPKLVVKKWRRARTNQRLGYATRGHGSLAGLMTYHDPALGKIQINLFKEDSTVEGAKRVLVHEVAHHVAWARSGRGHDDIFKAAHAELSQDALSRTPHAYSYCEGY
jgi:hypothetical protein